MSPVNITVAIPARNAERWIRDTIASVAAQDRRVANLRVVLVDDASSDGTMAIAAQALRDSGLPHDLIANKEALGPAACRNRCWRSAADADWIQFLDADDLLAPDKLTVQTRVVSSAGPDVAVVYSPWSSLIWASGAWRHATQTRRPSIGEDAACDILADANFIATGSQLFRRDWLLRVGGYVEGHHYVEDVELLLRLALAGGRLAEAPSATPLFFYRRHASSLTGTPSDGFIEGCIRNANFAQRGWADGGMLTEARRSRLAEIHDMAARHYAGRDRAAFDQAVDALLTLRPDFRPTARNWLRVAIALAGYRRATWMAAHLRKWAGRTA